MVYAKNKTIEYYSKNTTKKNNYTNSHFGSIFMEKSLTKYKGNPRTYKSVEQRLNLQRSWHKGYSVFYNTTFQT